MLLEMFEVTVSANVSPTVVVEPKVNGKKKKKGFLKKIVRKLDVAVKEQEDKPLELWQIIASNYSYSPDSSKTLAEILDKIIKQVISKEMKLGKFLAMFENIKTKILNMRNELSEEDEITDVFTEYIGNVYKVSGVLLRRIASTLDEFLKLLFDRDMEPVIKYLNKQLED